MKINEMQEWFQSAAAPSFERVRADIEEASHKVKPLLEYIECNLFDPALNVTAMKVACGIGDNSITIHFHREMDLPPKAYITQLRLETSARLLVATKLQVWRVAELVGYSSLGVYSKAFNRWAGVRPNAYREQKGKESWVFFSPEVFRRALAGNLPAKEALTLINRLLALYPQTETGSLPVCTHLGANGRRDPVEAPER